MGDNTENNTIIIDKTNITINNKEVHKIREIGEGNILYIENTTNHRGIVLINRKCYEITGINGSELTFLDNFISGDISVGDELIVPNMISDIVDKCEGDEVVEIKKNIYKILRNFMINGFFYDRNIILYFDEENNFKINDGGYFKLNKTKYNVYNNNSPYSDTHCTVIVTGPYGRDKYRYNGHCPVNDGGFMDFNNVNIYNLSNDAGDRSDFDFRIGSFVNLFNVKLFGMSESYHHINTENIRIYNFTVIDSYSVELLQSPIEMDNFNSLNCHYGLSFYPPSSIDHVEIKNSFISDSIQKIKRNARSNILLTDPTFDLFGEYSGTTPIKVCYTQQDQLLNKEGEPLQNINVKYFGEEYKVVSIDKSNNKVKLVGSDMNFIHFKKGDDIILRKTENKICDGEKFTIINVINDSIFLDTKIVGDYIADESSVHYLQERITNDIGLVDSVYVPIEYMERGSTEIKKYGKMTRVACFDGTNMNISIIYPQLKNKTTLIYEKNDESSESPIAPITTVYNTDPELFNNCFFSDFCNIDQIVI